jgi:hypothetical protein
MTQLEIIKGKTIEIPRYVNRYLILVYRTNSGWTSDINLFTNPESAIQNFMDRQNKYTDINIKYYKVVELEVEIPFVPETKL